MNAFHASLLNAPLLFSPEWSQQALQFFHQLLSETRPADATKTPVAPRVQLVEYAQLAGPHMGSLATWMAGQATALAAGSVAIVNMTGPLIRYTYWMPSTEDYRLVIETLLATPEISGIVLVTDSPGGQAAGIAGLYDVIATSEKPIIALVNGNAASAAYYAICGAAEIWASQPSDMIGSIGAYITLLDASKAYESFGYKLIEIYARVSSQKNLPSREALNGNPGPMQDLLDELVGFFHQAVKDGRGDLLPKITAKTPAADNPFEGAMYFAAKAKSLGLIDQIGTLKGAVARVYELAQTGWVNPRAASELIIVDDEEEPADDVQESETTLTTNPNTPDMGLFDKQPKLTALRGVAAADIPEEAVEAINADLAEQGINLTVLSNADITRLEGLETTNATLTTTNANLTAEVKRLGAQAGEKPSAPAKLEEATPTSTAEQATETGTFLSESDATLAEMRKQLNPTKQA